MTIEAATRRVRPAMMTSATTILALLPILTSTGRGADVMLPMAIPSFGGMLFELMTIFQAPILYCMLKERVLRKTLAATNGEKQHIGTKNHRHEYTGRT
jgi:Cu(I)/Ag(I) efflux system membrane protein CusA/SilA